jgi:ATP-dependent RNA helicase SUPV3L1/SUV3
MRRLRENTMLNTEIGKTGEVTVEGHVIGRLDGFTFAPDAAEAGSDAKALQATALKALAGEIDARAEKLSSAPDDQFVLASDGTVRWTGDAVAKLVAADDVLHPRLRIVADDRLAGAPRDAVQTRLDLWLKTHIEKLLGPLFDLAKAEDITGIARGIAFQLIESLGVLERQKIAAEMKDLDQPSRATLRKYGVRFGAYHIYIPSLLKPAARSLASLLWAQKLDNVDMAALSGAQHLAGSGRTSFPVDKSLDRDAYRTLGYKLCGERAVRVDILERLADLIRPALSWREGSSGEKPSGAFDGRSFVVTQAMTSLTGSAGEDFASVLRALGYRMEKKPPLPPAAPKVAIESAEAPVVDERSPEEIAILAGAIALEPEVAVATGEIADITNDAPPQADASAPEPVAEITAPVADEAQSDPATMPAAEIAAAEAPQQDTPADETTAVAVPEVSADAAAQDSVAATPELVEVWRPGGRSDESRPRHDRSRYRNQDRPRQGAEPAAAEAVSGEAVKRDRPDRGRRDRNNEFRRSRPEPGAEGAPASAEGAPRQDAGQGKPRPPRERFQGKGRDRDKFQGGPKGGRDSHGGGGSHRQVASSAPPRERDRPMDPNSPFAKLAALKEQLTANRKD